VGGRAGALLGWVGFVVGGWAGEWVGARRMLCGVCGLCRGWVGGSEAEEECKEARVEEGRAEGGGEG
jgi:hypothetical protein